LGLSNAPPARFHAPLRRFFATPSTSLS